MGRRKKFCVIMAIVVSTILICSGCSKVESEENTSTTQNTAAGDTKEQSASDSTLKQNNGKVKKSDKANNKIANNKTSTSTPVDELITINENFLLPEVLGRPTEDSVTVSVVPKKEMRVYVEYGIKEGSYEKKTETVSAEAGVPMEILLENLEGDTEYFYRVRYEGADSVDFEALNENSFFTQRAPGSTFTFGIQGDSHPERASQFDSELYLQTMENVGADNPDFYLTMGDDFSVDTMKNITKEAVEGLYINQRKYLGQIGGSTPLFLVNGNHEQAAQYVLDGTADNPAVWGQNARNEYFPQPAPDDFYTGDKEQVEFIGNLRDYYAWTWGDALFVVIDPYWHSSVPVDNTLQNSSDKRTDMWDVTLGDDQYQWFKETLEESDAKYKFVFTHHVLGTGRGGTDVADKYEWGGYGNNGEYEFDSKRPGWDMPIQELMAENDVTIFFQGHDHIFVKQELDGVVYQSLPEPADPNYALNNADAYESDYEFASSGHVRVTVSPEEVKVEYVKSLLPKDETDESKNGDVIFSYSVAGE